MNKLLIILTTFTQAFASLPSSFEELNERNIQVLRLEVTSPLFQLSENKLSYLEQEYKNRKKNHSKLVKRFPMDINVKELAKMYLADLNESNKKIESLFVDAKKNQAMQKATKNQEQINELTHTQQLIELKIEEEIDAILCPDSWNFLFYPFLKQINSNSEFSPENSSLHSTNSPVARALDWNLFDDENEMSSTNESVSRTLNWGLLDDEKH